MSLLSKAVVGTPAPHHRPVLAARAAPLRLAANKAALGNTLALTQRRNKKVVQRSLKQDVFASGAMDTWACIGGVRMLSLNPGEGLSSRNSFSENGLRALKLSQDFI
eukprot:989824-Pyramimonas_sp.AAC.1